jgi:hypothetical protein
VDHCKLETACPVNWYKNCVDVLTTSQIAIQSWERPLLRQENGLRKENTLRYKDNPFWNAVIGKVG